MFRTLVSYFKPHMGIFILDMCCAVFVAAVEPCVPPRVPARHV